MEPSAAFEALGTWETFGALAALERFCACDLALSKFVGGVVSLEEPWEIALGRLLVVFATLLLYERAREFALLRFAAGLLSPEDLSVVGAILYVVISNRI